MDNWFGFLTLNQNSIGDALLFQYIDFKTTVAEETTNART